VAGALDDFMERFSSGCTLDENEAAQYHDHFVSINPKDSSFDNSTYNRAATQYLGRLPDGQFHNAARAAITQATPQERAGLMRTLIQALITPSGLGGGLAILGGPGGLANMLGLGSIDPNRMSADDAGKLMYYARKKQPVALQQTVAEKPWLIKAMGNPVVTGALTMAAAKLLSRPRQSE
jgi:hypothetical protein